jgi:hypothetical protein
MLIASLVAGVFCTQPLARAASPAIDSIVPATTKLFVSIPDPDTARKQFDASQLGELVNHEEMKPFNDDLEKQLEGQGRLAERLGIAIGELEGVYGGEMAMAVIRPASEKDGFATAFIVDVAGHGEAATDMLRKVRARRRALAPGKVTTPSQKFGEIVGMAIKVPADKAKKRPAITSYYYFFGTLLIACDHLKEAQDIHARLVAGGGKDSLASFAPYANSMNEVKKASQDVAAPNVKWFMEPLGFQRVRRAEQIADGTRPPGGVNQIDIYEKEGFDAVQGIGGWVNFSEQGYEVLHRALVYAPPVNRASKDPEIQRRITIEKHPRIQGDETPYEGPENKKYLLGMRLFHFFNAKPLSPLAWIPNDVATHLAFNWHLQRAFKYSETLMNARSDEVGTQTVWADTLESIRDDQDGPKVDVRKDIVLQLGTHTTQITDFLRPITPESERTVLIFEIKGDVANVDKALTRMMEVEMEADGAKKHVVGDHVIWQLLPLSEVDDGRGGRDEDEEERLMPPASFCVAHGCLLRGSHVDAIEKLLKKADATLAEAADLKQVNDELDKLSDGEESFRYFDRLDRSMEIHWELLRVGKFPQANTMLSNMVARMQGYDTDDPETRERKQEIDASKLPQFPFAAPFLGPSGMIAKNRDDGWLVTGVVLTKKK